MSLSKRFVVTCGVTAVAAGLAAVVVLGAADPASADVTAAISASSLAASTVTDVTALKAGDDVNWSKVCARVPVALQRVQSVQTRFAADANTKGSIAYLEARIERLKAAGKTDAVTLLTNRLAVRKQLDATLPARIKQLQDAQVLCAKHTTPAPAASPSAS